MCDSTAKRAEPKVVKVGDTVLVWHRCLLVWTKQPDRVVATRTVHRLDRTGHPYSTHVQVKLLNNGWQDADDVWLVDPCGTIATS